VFSSILEIVFATSGLKLLAMRSLWWMFSFVFWVIAYAAFGVTLLFVYPVGWMVRSVARLADGAHHIHSSRADSAAAISRGAPAQGAKVVPAPRMWRPSFPDVAISVREASETLFAYERRAFRARADMRETARRTLETIAQTQALMAQVDAAAAGRVVSVVIAPPVIVAPRQPSSSAASRFTRMYAD
jgi:hypothetical protein